MKHSFNLYSLSKIISQLFLLIIFCGVVACVKKDSNAPVIIFNNIKEGDTLIINNGNLPLDINIADESNLSNINIKLQNQAGTVVKDTSITPKGQAFIINSKVHIDTTAGINLHLLKITATDENNFLGDKILKFYIDNI